MTTPKPPPSSSPPIAGVADAGPQRDAASRVLRQFRVVFNSVKTHFQQVEKVAGIGGSQVWVLSVVRESPGIGINDLARALDVRQPTASNLVKSLNDQGLLEVRRNDDDRRAVKLYLRPQGEAVLLRAPGPFTGVLPQALALLDAPTLERLEADLAVLIDVLGADERGARIQLSRL